MREIKFRVWYNEGMWYSIPSIQFNKDGVSNVNINTTPNDFDPAPDTWTGKDEYHLMQFTGLKDKNGKEIYEGDFVKASRREENYVVIWHHCGFFLQSTDTGDIRTSLWSHHLSQEIIGNIHETPELL